MKRIIALLAIVGLGLVGFAGTCNLLHTSLTQIGSNDTYAGELQNSTGANFLGHKFKVAFVDANGNIVDTRTNVSGCLRSWQNGSSDFFSVASNVSSSTTTAAIAAIDFGQPLVVGNTIAGDVTLSNVTVVRNGTSLVVSGTIKNNDSVTLSSPAVCAVVYSSAGNIIVTGKTSPSSLSAGASETFTVTIIVPNSSATVNHVDLWADGLENNVPISPVSVTGRAVNIATATPTATATSTPCSSGGTPVACTPTNTPTPTNTATPTATATPTP
jgi:hypothetical protein